MLRIAIVAMTSLYLVACTYNPDKTTSAALNDERGPHAGEWAVAMIGTPFYLAAKTL